MKRIALFLFQRLPSGLLLKRRTMGGGIDSLSQQIEDFFTPSSLPFSAIP